MNEATTLVWVAVISLASAIGVQLVGEYFRRDKVSAETNALTSEEWRKLYNEMSLRLERMETRVFKLERELDIAKDYIQYLWLGTVKNMNYMREHGMEPPFVPQRTFRGADDFDPDEWDWIKGDD